MNHSITSGGIASPPCAAGETKTALAGGIGSTGLRQPCSAAASASGQGKSCIARRISGLARQGLASLYLQNGLTTALLVLPGQRLDRLIFLSELKSL